MMNPDIQKYLTDKYQLGMTDDEKQIMSDSEGRAANAELGQGLMEAADTIAAGFANRQKTKPLLTTDPNASSNLVRSYIMNKIADRRNAAKMEQDQAFKADEAEKKRIADAADAKYKSDMKSIEAGKALSDKEDKKNRQTSSDTQDLIKYRDSHDVTKQTNILAPAYKKITTMARAGTAAGDMGVIFGYMKMQDPTSTVREGEYATAQNAAGIPERLRILYNKAIDGQILGADQRADFVARAKEMYDSQMSAQSALDEQVMAEAKNRGLDPKRVIINPWSKTGVVDFSNPKQSSGEAFAVERDVSEYAKKHGISYEQAAQIKASRGRK